jgi:hypothetical protein
LIVSGARVMLSVTHRSERHEDSIIGNKNYSSWSLRPWIGLKAPAFAFDEEVIPLYGEGSKEKILAHSPPARCRS